MNSLLLSSAEQALETGTRSLSCGDRVSLCCTRGLRVSYWVSVKFGAVLAFPNYTISWEPK